MGRYRFGEFEFDADRGELLRVDGSDQGRPERLPPQPARLLGLLVARGGDLLTREEIKEGIWSGVEVDFDASLHFCIRQIRQALGDSASEPRYVETLPRRGYRLLPPVEPIDSPGRSRRRSWRWKVLGGAAAFTAIALAVGLRPSDDPPMRIGIMSFEPLTGSEPNAIAEVILETLTTDLAGRAEIVGPTSTTMYTDSSRSLRQLTLDYDLEYVINGRFIEDEHGARMLGELIRASDGAHVWVHSYEDIQDARRIGSEISAAVIEELAPRPRP